jgi:adenine-specific DNA methylase
LRSFGDRAAQRDADEWNDKNRKGIEGGQEQKETPADFRDAYLGRALVLEFIKHLVKWENSNNKEIIEKARRLIAAAHKFLHPESKDAMPKVLDPFAGGGAIPLEALRLGCEAHAIELNPVAHLIELCTLVYPQKYGQPNSRPTPDYIKKLQATHDGKGGDGLFSKKDGKSKAAGAAEIDGIALTRLPLITEAEYQKNPLAADVKFWGHWVLEKARDEIGQCYPIDPDGGVPIAYLWARTVKCPNPACGATVPLVRQLWLCKKPNRKIALRMIPEPKQKRCCFEVVEGTQIDFDPDQATMQRGNGTCPFCRQVAAVNYMREECRAGRMGQQMMAIVSTRSTSAGQGYLPATTGDEQLYEQATRALADLIRKHGEASVPEEPLPPVGTLGFRVNNYGLTKWGDVFNARQKLALVTFSRLIGQILALLPSSTDNDYSHAVISVIGTNFGRAPDHWSTLCRWNSSGPKLQATFGRQALPMVWDYAEANPFGGSVGDWSSSINWNAQNSVAAASAASERSATVVRGTATSIASTKAAFSAVVTDPPYYDAVPYADLSDFFYVWLKRILGEIHQDVLRTPLTPKQQELVSHLPNSARGLRMNTDDYERGMAQAFAEMHRVLGDDGICGVMFAHKTTSAWETIIAGLLRSGLRVTGSWPFHTEMRTRLRGMDSAALASSVTLVCRKRLTTAGEGYWDDVRDELREVARERLDFFWQQGIRGADFFISAIGPALSVYGRYAKVTRLTGEEVSVGQFLDEVRGIVTDYALSQILHGAKTGQIDSETRFYVLWKWSYADAKVPADEAFKLAQALGIGTESMWDRTGVLEKQGENVQALTTAKRMRINDLGEPNVDGSPAPLIDALHRCCAFRDKGDTGGLSEYLARSGHGKSEKLWTVAQAMSEVLPDGDKEKQLLQGLLNQRDKVEEEMKEGRLF